MKILVIGSGGREHAIAWRLATEGHSVVGAPGNSGTEDVGTRVNSTDYLAVAREHSVDFTVVGPEAPLAAGVVDQFRASGLAIVGPSHDQAQLESSKVYAKAFMEETGIPTARAVRVDSHEDARARLEEFSFPVVIKADGLAAGKGVIIAPDMAAAVDAIKRLGPRLVIEEYLEGEEVSFIALCDGRDYALMQPSQDHKRLLDGDRGPNTGGMGAYTDSRILPAAAQIELATAVIAPVIERLGFTGFLYAGLMMTSDGLKVLEYNVRLGDPETQPLMCAMAGDFGELLAGAARGTIADARMSWKPGASVCVVAAAEGYPDQPKTGAEIHGVEQCAGRVFHAGTRRVDGKLVVSGGRVLGVTASGTTLQDAIASAYADVDKIQFDGMQYRKDIGKRGLARW